MILLIGRKMLIDLISILHFFPQSFLKLWGLFTACLIALAGVITNHGIHRNIHGDYSELTDQQLFVFTSA